MKRILNTLLLTASLALAAALPCAAQTYKTNDMALPAWATTMGLGTASNTVAIANSAGYTNSTPYRFNNADALAAPWQIIVAFSAPTNSLLASSFVFGFSADGVSYENIPNRQAHLIVPASATGAGNTNYIAVLSSTDTNLFGRLPPSLPYVTMLGTTNGNASTFSISRITVRERY
jgi:hypothetical protein